MYQVFSWRSLLTLSFVIAFFVFGVAIPVTQADDDHPENASWLIPEGTSWPEGVPHTEDTPRSYLNTEGDLGFCFDTYTDRMMVQNVVGVKEMRSGTTLSYQGVIWNNNPYAIVDGSVLVKVFQVYSTEAPTSYRFVEKFTPKMNFSLLAEQSVPLNFDYVIPSDVPSGQYRLEFFVQTGHFDVGGISASDSLSAGSLDFTVSGGKAAEKTPAVAVNPETSPSPWKFPSVKQYPLKAGEENQLFSCLYGTEGAPLTGSKLVMTLKDTTGAVIHTVTSEGNGSGMAKAVKEAFIPQKTYTDFTLEAQLYRDGKLVDEATMKYDCQAFGSCLAKSDAPTKVPLTPDRGTFSSEKLIFGLIAFAGIIMLGILMWSLIRRKNRTFLGLFWGGLALLTALGGTWLLEDVERAEAVVVPGERYVGSSVLKQARATMRVGTDPVTGLWTVTLGRNFSLGIQNRCVLTGWRYDGDGIGACIIRGSQGGSWSVEIQDEGSRVNQDCYILCNRVSAAGNLSNAVGTDCTYSGREGVVDGRGLCCTGTYWNIGSGTNYRCGAPDPVSALKICEGSCDSSIDRTNQVFTMGQSETRNLKACFNTASACTSASGDVTNTAVWTDTNLPQNVISLPSRGTLQSGVTSGAERFQVTYGGETQTATAQISCIPLTCASARSVTDGYCSSEIQDTGVSDGCSDTLTCPGTGSCADGDSFYREVSP